LPAFFIFGLLRIGLINMFAKVFHKPKNEATMKIVTRIILLTFVLTIAANTFTLAQKKADKSPMPVGGMEAVAKKVVAPAEVEKKKIKGEVQVMVTCDSTGAILATSIFKALSPACDSAAIKAVRSVKFKPGEKDGKKTKKKVIIPINF
jgi:TonB family protein